MKNNSFNFASSNLRHFLCQVLELKVPFTLYLTKLFMKPKSAGTIEVKFG